MKSQKGEAWGDIKYAVIATIIIVLLAAFTYNYFTKVKEKIAIQDCQNSVSAHALLTTVTEFQVITDIKCPTREITVKTINQEKANKQIAEDMHRCWYEWGRGNYRMFEGDGVFCHVCSIYAFDNKSERINGFTNYIATQPITVRFAGDIPKTTYLQYIQGVKNVDSRTELLERYTDEVSTDDYIDTSQKYSTIFVYASGKSAIDKALENGGRITAGTVGTGAVLAGIAATGTGITAGISMIGTAAATAASATAAGATLTTAGALAAMNWWNPVGWIVGGVVVGVAGYLAIDAATSHEKVEWVSFVVFRPYTPDELTALGCEKVPVNQQSHAAP